MIPEEFLPEVACDLDPAETGNSGCLIPENDDGHCDAESEEDDDE